MRTRSMVQAEGNSNTVLNDVTKIVAQKDNVVAAPLESKVIKQSATKAAQEDKPVAETRSTRGAKKTVSDVEPAVVVEKTSTKTGKTAADKTPAPVDENANPVRTHIRFGDVENDDKIEKIPVELKKPEEYPLFPYREPVQEDDLDDEVTDDVTADADQENTDEFIVAPLPSVPAWEGKHTHFDEDDDTEMGADKENLAGDLASHLSAMTMDCAEDVTSEETAPAAKSKKTKKAAEPVTEAVAAPSESVRASRQRSAKK